MKKECEREGCNVIFYSKYKNNIYCSRSCSAKVNNSKYPKRIPITFNTCNNCGEKVNNQKTKYCKKCYFEIVVPERSKIKLEKWLSGEWQGGTGEGIFLSVTIRKYLLEKAKYKCTKCGFATPHPEDGSSILEINHINGDGTDHRPGNLEVLCPNCHTRVFVGVRYVPVRPSRKGGPGPRRRTPARAGTRGRVPQELPTLATGRVDGRTGSGKSVTKRYRTRLPYREM